MHIKDYGRGYGLAAEALKMLGNLAKQIEKQGGDQGLVRLLEKERVISRVADVLIHAGDLNRPHGFYTNGNWTKVFFEQFKVNNITTIEEFISSISMRLATKAELEQLWNDYPDLLKYEDKMIIVGQLHENINEVSAQYWTMTKAGVSIKYILHSQLLNEEYRFATIFNEP